MLSILRRKKKTEQAEQKSTVTEYRDVSKNEIEIVLSLDPNVKRPKIEKRPRPEPPKVDMSPYADLSPDVQKAVEDKLLNSIYSENPRLKPSWADMDDEFIERMKSISMADMYKLDAVKIVYTETGDVERCIRYAEAI